MEDIVLVTFKLFGYNLPITLSMVMQWVVMIIIIFLVFKFGSNLNKFPDRRQGIAEIFVDTIDNIIKANMGEQYREFIPFFGTLALYMILLNFVGLFGITPPTTNYSVTLGLGLISFLVIQGYTIKKIGLFHYFLGYTKPIIVLLPINILERIALPVSLSLRLFGNMFAATMIMDLIYKGLGSISPFATIGIPILFHGYFDLFDGTLQMVIFVMLTMINIKIISEH